MPDLKKDTAYLEVLAKHSTSHHRTEAKKAGMTVSQRGLSAGQAREATINKLTDGVIKKLEKQRKAERAAAKKKKR